MREFNLIPPKRRPAGDAALVEADAALRRSRDDTQGCSDQAAMPKREAGELTAVLPPENRLAGDATLWEAEAKLKRSQANAEVCPERAATLRREAGELTAEADRVRSMAQACCSGLSVGRGGEISSSPQRGMPVNVFLVAETVQKTPDTLDAEASFTRLGLAREAGVLTTAVATAESVGAEGAVEQMMAHQLAAAHSTAMRLMAVATKALSRHESECLMGNMAFLTEAAKSASAAARLMHSFTQNASGLHRIRHGGRQHVTVQHVHVSEGGQAVVAGSMGAPGKPSRERVVGEA